MFDWLRFFEQHAIEFVRSGPNVARGNVNIRCPLCGFDDPSHHMGVSLDGKGWGCWRVNAHRGRSPARLVQLLLSCSAEEARLIVGNQRYLPEDFLGQVQSSLHVAPITSPRAALIAPESFKTIKPRPSAAPIIAYLVRRGFTRDQIDEMSDRFDLRYTRRGDFADRVLFLVKHDKQLVTWTGRSIHQDAVVRYKTLSDKKPDRQGNTALAPIANHLLWFDRLRRSRCAKIALVEGPFDALKVTLLGRSLGVCATCFFTMTPTDAQLALLYELLPRFDDRVLLLDRGTLPQALGVVSRLTTLGVRLLQLPPGYKDPGDLDSIGFAQLFA